MRSRGMIFDYDGLIVDSERACFCAWAELFSARGQELTSAEWHAAIGHVDNYDPVAALEDRLGRPLDRERLVEEHRGRFLELFAEETPLPGARELILASAEAGCLLGVASNATTGWVESGLEKFGLRGAFLSVRGRDRAARPKPAPDVYLAVASDLGCAPGECVAFEDSEPGVAAASAAGLRVVAVPNALTRHGDFSLAHEVLDSLAHYGLPEIASAAAR